MTRCKSWTAILALLIVATALTTTAVLAPKAEATALNGRLRHARHELRQARHRLTAARVAVAAALVATASGVIMDPATTTTDPATTTTDAATTTTDPATAVTDVATTTADPASSTPAPAATTALAVPVSPTLAELRAKVDERRRAVRRWTNRVRRLARRVRLQRQLVAWESHGTWRPIIEMAAAKYHVNADGMYRMMMRESGGSRYAGSSSPYKGLFQYWTGTWAGSWNPYRHDSIYDGSSQIYATACAIHKGLAAQMWTSTWASQY